MSEEAGFNWAQAEKDYIRIGELEQEVVDLREAAEFEARVVAKLTELAHWIAQGIGADMECTDLCDASDICENAEEMPCKWCFLKWARLQVEEEMKKCIK